MGGATVVKWRVECAGAAWFVVFDTHLLLRLSARQLSDYGVSSLWTLIHKNTNVRCLQVRAESGVFLCLLTFSFVSVLQETTLINLLFFRCLLSLFLSFFPPRCPFCIAYA